MRPDLSKTIVISPEAQCIFDEFKQDMESVRRCKIFVSVQGFVVAVLFSLFLLTNKMLFIVFDAIILSLVAVIIVVMQQKSYLLKNGSNTQWYKKCIKPIMEQLVEDVRYEDCPNHFPGLKDWYSPNTLGEELHENYIMPFFNYKFETDGLYENLYADEDGFALMNVKATSLIKDKDGPDRIVTDFNGTLFAVKMDFSLSDSVSLHTTKNLLGLEFTPFKKIKKPIDVENTEFNKTFQVYSKNQIAAFRFLSPLVIENLLKFKEEYPTFGMYAKNNYLYFTISSKKWLLAPPTGILEIKRYSFDNAIEEVKKVLDLIYSVKDAVNLTWS